MNFNIRDRTVFMVLAGSRAYGTHREDSDYDYRGIAIPPMDSYIGIKNKFENAVSKELGKEYPEIQDDADVQVYELTKFVKLASECNPSIIEILFTDTSNYIIHHPIMDKLIENRNLFLSKIAKDRFCGYAFSQLKRIKRHKRFLDNPPKAPPNRADFGLPDRKLIPLDQLGAAEALIRIEVDKFMVEQTDLHEHTRIALAEQMEKTLKFSWWAIHQDRPYPLDDKFDSLLEAQELAVGKQLGFSDNFLQILDAEKRYKLAKKEWNSYQTWVNTRNPKRFEIERKYGFDCKNALHLVRLIKMSREILETGKVNVLRPDAEELKSILNGSMTYEEIVEFAEKSDSELTELAQRSILPRVPDINKIHEITYNLVTEYNQEKI